jgi:lysozyme family protein
MQQNAHHTLNQKTTKMANIDKLIPFILKWEGGFVNDPTDRGGATNKGVTLATYEAYCKRKGYPRPTVERLKNIPDAHWREIVKTMFWDKWKADDIHSQKVANILVDWVWGSGIHGIKKPQALLGVKVDGIVGDKTLSAVNFADPEELFDAIYQERVKFLNAIVSNSVAAYEKKIGRKATDAELLKYTQKRFIKGWLNRLQDIKKL